MSLRYETVYDLAEGLASHRFSSTELTQDYLARIDADDSNALVTITREAALDAADAADNARAEGGTHALAGVPMVHKDIFCTNGVTTTAGSRMLENFVAPYDATVVEKIAATGMIMLGKANMDEFAMGSSNENSHFGPVHNPWGKNLVPGGSSGGSATAVAAGLTPFATGTDTGLSLIHI